MGEYTDALAEHKTVRRAAAARGEARSTFFDHLKSELAAGTIGTAVKKTRAAKASSGETLRFIFSAAVSGADVHEPFLKNLEAYAQHVGASIEIGPLAGTSKQRYSELKSSDFAPSVRSYYRPTPLSMMGKIRFCPELNLTPTAAQPLSGLQTYTKGEWSIFPHTKVSLESIATHKDRESKQIMTTGAVTLPHYTATKAGHRARFDHIVGALLVEVNKDGIWARQLAPANMKDGTFYDLDKVVSDGRVRRNADGVAALVYGDIHVEKLDPVCASATWGYGQQLYDRSLVQILRPQRQVFHDLIDAAAANPHELDDIFARYAAWVDGDTSVASGFREAFEFMGHVARYAKDNVVVDSNHDYFVKRWLLHYDPSRSSDFENMTDYYRLKLAVLECIEEQKPYSLLEVLFKELGNEKALKVLEKFQFLCPDEPYGVGGIELGWHGHKGPDGRRGNKRAFINVAERSVIAHFHAAAINSGSYVVGTSSLMDLGYNVGPSSWTHTHCVIYPSGRRALLTMSDGKFWSDQ